MLHYHLTPHSHAPLPSGGHNPDSAPESMSLWGESGILPSLHQHHDPIHDPSDQFKHMHVTHSGP